MPSEPSSLLFRAANALMAALFVFAAAVQVNDPDPLRWMALYLAAAVACVLAVLRRLPRWLPIVVGLAASAWAATLAPHVLGRVGWGEMVEAWEMKDVRVEEGRETYGLLIVAAWMAILVFAGRHRAARVMEADRQGAAQPEASCVAPARSGVSPRATGT